MSQRHLGHLGNGARKFHPHRARAHQDECEQLLYQRVIGVPGQRLPLCLFKRHQKPAPISSAFSNASSPGAIAFHSSWPK